MKNRITIAAVFTACLALCAAVWPQAETVGEIPELPQTPAVSAPEATVAEREEKFEATPPSEKEKTESLQLPTHDQRLHQSLLRNLFLHSPRYRRSLARSPAIWSMWKASVGWSTKGQIAANTARTFTKTATKSASWADLKNCAA